MAKDKQDPAVSSEMAIPEQVTAEVVDDQVEDAEISAAVERVANFVQKRGFGMNTTRLIGYIAEKSVDEADLNVVITEMLAERLLNATSPEDILTPFDPKGAKEFYGKPLYIMGCTFIESDYEGFPWYVSLQAQDPKTSETFALTVGGEKVVMQAAGFDRAKLWPAYITICEAEKETKGGFRPLEMRPVKII